MDFDNFDDFEFINTSLGLDTINYLNTAFKFNDYIRSEFSYDMDTAIQKLQEKQDGIVYSMATIRRWLFDHAKLYAKEMRPYLNFNFVKGTDGYPKVVWYKSENDFLSDKFHPFLRLYKTATKYAKELRKEPDFEKIMNEYYEVHSLNSKLEEAWLKEYRSLGVNYYFENESVHSNLPGIERAKGLFYTKTPLIKIQVDAKEFQYSIAFGEKIWELIEVYEWNNKKHGFQE